MIAFFAVTTEGAPAGDGGEESVPTDLKEEEKTELDENNDQVQSEAGEAVPEGSVEIQVQVRLKEPDVLKPCTIFYRK